MDTLVLDQTAAITEGKPALTGIEVMEIAEDRALALVTDAECIEAKGPGRRASRGNW